MAKERITSADVARASGVSRATVSYVLNNDPRQTISAETREKVLHAAKELGYTPFTAAKILRAGYSRLVLAVVPYELVDPGIALDLKQLEAGLAEQGFSLIWSVGLNNKVGQVHLSANLTPSAVVSFAEDSDPTVKAFLQQFNVPVISMRNPSFGVPVGRLQVEHLVKLGFQKMVYASTERSDVQELVQERHKGVAEKCKELDLPLPLVQNIPWQRAGAEEAIATLLEQQAPPFGICCYNDEVAIAVLAALTKTGIRVPESVAVIGCDDIPFAQFTTPPLTTVATVEEDKQYLLSSRIADIVAASNGEATGGFPSARLTIIQRASA